MNQAYFTSAIELAEVDMWLYQSVKLVFLQQVTNVCGLFIEMDDEHEGTIEFLITLQTIEKKGLYYFAC